LRFKPKKCSIGNIKISSNIPKIEYVVYENTKEYELLTDGKIIFNESTITIVRRNI